MVSVQYNLKPQFHSIRQSLHGNKVDLSRVSDYNMSAATWWDTWIAPCSNPMSLIIDIVNSHISLLGHNFKWWGGWIPSHISENGQSYIYCDLAAYSGIMQQKLRGGG